MAIASGADATASGPTSTGVGDMPPASAACCWPAAPEFRSSFAAKRNVYTFGSLGSAVTVTWLLSGTVAEGGVDARVVLPPRRFRSPASLAHIQTAIATAVGWATFAGTSCSGLAGTTIGVALAT